MRLIAPLLLLLVYSSLTSRPPARAEQAPMTAAAPAAACGDIGTAQTRTTLYFGLDSPAGLVSETKWQSFLKNEVTPRFPQGFTVWEANGQWRRTDGAIVHERSKVLLLVHQDTSAVHQDLAAIIERYKRAYQQESVLWETARVCAAF